RFYFWFDSGSMVCSVQAPVTSNEPSSVRKSRACSPQRKIDAEPPRSNLAVGRRAQPKASHRRARSCCTLWPPTAQECCQFTARLAIAAPQRRAHTSDFRPGDAVRPAARKPLLDCVHPRIRPAEVRSSVVRDSRQEADPHGYELQQREEHQERG